MILTSPMLERIGVRHGFSTRLGGVSSGPQATLDCGPGSEERCRENLRRFAGLIGLSEEQRIVRVNQIHGARVVGAADEGADADGIVSEDPRAAVSVRTADCAPILIADEDGAMVAAVHAGWRGACAGIAGVAVEAMEARGARRERLCFALGPTIGIDWFEVGDEVMEAARLSLGGEEPAARRGPNGRMHLDLLGLIERQLERLGVSPHRIERVGGCTFTNRAMFFSHRRDRGNTGRLMSAIAPRSSRPR
jgi:YfiH family protein